MLAVDVRHELPGRAPRGGRAAPFVLHARFEAPPGVTVLFGPSGAGKTLTLRVIAGLDRPTAGRVRLGDRVLTDVASGVHTHPRHRGIGMVFQEARLLPHRSVLANVALAVRTGSRTARREQAHALLERVDAAALATRRPAELSGGQQQRAALARALAGGPRLLLLDEPFGALDLPVRRVLRQLVGDLVAEAGVPAVFVTHDRDELAALADRVAFAAEGAVTATTDRGEALARIDAERA